MYPKKFKDRIYEVLNMSMTFNSEGIFKIIMTMRAKMEVHKKIRDFVF